MKKLAHNVRRPDSNFQLIWILECQLLSLLLASPSSTISHTICPPLVGTIYIYIAHTRRETSAKKYPLHFACLSPSPNNTAAAKKKVFFPVNIRRGTDLWTHSSPVNKLNRLNRSQNPCWGHSCAKLRAEREQREQVARERVWEERELQTLCLPNHHGDPNKSESWAFNETSPSLFPSLTLARVFLLSCKFIQLFCRHEDEASSNREISFSIGGLKGYLRAFHSLEISLKRVESFWAFRHVQWICGGRRRRRGFVPVRSKSSSSHLVF